MVRNVTFGNVTPCPEVIILPPPTSAGGTITRQILLHDISTDNVALGGMIILDGNMTRDNGVGGWEPAALEPVSLFIDDMEITPANNTDVNGNFILSYTIPTAWSVAGTHTILANLSRSSSYLAIVYNAPLSFNVYTDSNITTEDAVFGGHYLLGDEVTLSGKLTSLSVPTHNIGGRSMIITAGGNPFSVTTTSAGVATLAWTISSENPTITFDFAGVPEDYLPAAQVVRYIDTLQAGDAKFATITYPSTTYERNSIDITGTLVWEGDGATPLSNRRLLLEIHNASVETRTNANGLFALSITVPDGVGPRDLNFTLLYANGGKSPVGVLIPQAITVGSYLDPNNPDNSVPYPLIVIGVIAVVAIIVILVLIRKGVIKLQRARPVYEVNQKTLMDRVDALAAMGRLPEAMAYLLVKYLDALRFRMQMTKKRGQTVRDIATEAVRRHLHQAEILYPWTSFVEAAIYSGRTVNIRDLEHVKAFYQTAQKIVPFSEQELTAFKPASGPETSPSQAITEVPAPKNNEKGEESKDASE